LAVDLDGTLLDARGQVRPADRDALREAASRGVAVSIVTGRLYSGSRAAARAIGAAGPIGCVDGGHIVHAGTEVELAHHALAGETVERLREAVRDNAPACFAFAHDEIVHDAAGEPYLGYVRTWSERVVKHARTIDHPHWAHPRGLSAVVCVGAEASIKATHGAITARVAGAQAVSFPVFRSTGHDEKMGGTWGMVIRAAGVSKGTAVSWIAAHHGLSLGEVVVVGDWLNDLPMFEVAGRSFAMGQAPENVKRAATDVLEATSETGGGVAEAARRAGLIP
jgi:HAD superfamily hydrolase (TIGR01484 family)